MDPTSKHQATKCEDDVEEEDTHDYNAGSDVPPPPSYDEALQHSMEKPSIVVTAPIASLDDEFDEDDDGSNDRSGAEAPTEVSRRDDDDGSDDDRSIAEAPLEVTRRDDDVIEEANGGNDDGRQPDSPNKYGDEEDKEGTSGKEEELEAKRHRDVAMLRQESMAGAMGDGRLDEIEMMDINTDNGGAIEMDTIQVDTGRYSPRHSNYGDDDPDTDQQDAEANKTQGRRRRRRSFDTGLPIPVVREIINFIINRIVRTYDNWPDYSNQKRLIVVVTVLFTIGMVLLVTLLPASFVYVDYYEMGFIHNNLTGTTDTSRVIQHGCHLFAPQHTLILFPATAQFVDLDLASINSDGLNIKVEAHFQYLLRPSELSTLFKNYDMNYQEVVHNKAETLLKTAITQLTLEELRLNRSMVQNHLLQALSLGLSGDCCSHKASSRGAQHILDNSACNAAKTCSQGQHVDVTSFQMGALTIPYQVTQNYLKQFTLELEAERELFIQEGAVVRKETVAVIQNIENEAKEIREAATAASKKIKTISEAFKMKMLELSYAQALNSTYSKLGITKEDEKISLLYFRSLKDARDNLYAFSYNYDSSTAYHP